MIHRQRRTPLKGNFSTTQKILSPFPQIFNQKFNLKMKNNVFTRKKIKNHACYKEMPSDALYFWIDRHASKPAVKIQ